VVVDQWHRDRGWAGIGYHFVIGNGYPYSRDPDTYNPMLDGQIEAGRNVLVRGAHVRDDNHDTIGICLIGVGGVNGTITRTQLDALKTLVYWLMAEHGIAIEGVLGHYELDQKKTCPEIPMGLLRDFLGVAAVSEEENRIFAAMKKAGKGDE
jgi:hypothetical protein